ncbi:MAG: right-handed parallel beta-helix repeat-containing protein [Gaiellaceae bacterium MAG52_C11]|nr:right-handed parallel beta-helix repeat-containing protein [Candidatus Gaiellasilicea maunaloa]
MVLALAAAAGSAQAATFYVSPAGADANPGTSAAAPWKTVSRVNNAALAPGDVVSFQGGATFSDATLMPGSSGTAAARITFTSYGTGRATLSYPQSAVWLAPGRNYLTFAELDLTTGGAAYTVLAGSSAPGSSYITIRDCSIRNGGATGIGSWQSTDEGWRIESTTLSHIGDSAITTLGNGTVIEGNRISDVGWNASLDWTKHGIYSKGPNHVIANNEITDVPNGQAVSLRYRGARVYGNTIHDTPYAIGFFDYDTSPAPQGTSYVHGNRAWNVTGWFFYYAGQRDPNGRVPSVGFVVASNSVSLTGATEAVNVSEAREAPVTFANNVVTGSYSSAFRPLAGKTFEFNNAWSGGAFNVPTGSVSDVFGAPGISSPSGFAPLTGSPVIDRGSAVVPGLAYARRCDGIALSYCGLAPDIGAVESAILPPSPLSPTLPPPSPEPGAAVLPTVTISSPAADGAVGRSLKVVASARSDSAIAGLAFLVDGKQICRLPAGSGSCVSRLHPGDHTIMVRATDATGDVGSASQLVRSARGRD